VPLSLRASNGYTTKRLLTDDGEFELDTPRDRDGTFEPQFIKKSQTRITQMDSQILSLYAKGMTTRDIVATFKEMYDADVSATLISKVTDAVIDQVTQWQNRPLDAFYPIVYLDCIVVKVRHNNTVINKAVFLALGVNVEGRKDLLGLWVAENEGAKYWTYDFDNVESFNVILNNGSGAQSGEISGITGDTYLEYDGSRSAKKIDAPVNTVAAAKVTLSPNGVARYI
jgi:transposase-like protein